MKYFCGKRIESILLLLLIWSSCSTKKEHRQTNANDLNFEYIMVDSAGPLNPWTKINGDLDGDGIDDIIIGGQKGPLVWYKFPDWKKFPIADGGYDTVDGEAGDIDGDGDLDMVMGGLYWYENNPDEIKGYDQLWEVHKIAEHPTHDIEIADINADGRMDVITRNQSAFSDKKGNTIHIWINKENDKWVEHVLTCPHGEGLDVGDLDKDGDPDIAIGGIWFENQNGKWEKHHFAEWYPHACVIIADINMDNRKDIVLTPSERAGSFFRISWMEAPDKPSADHWKEHVLFDSVECVVHSLAVADLNLDSANDIVYAEMHQGADPDEVVVLLNENNGEKWSKKVLSKKGSHEIRIADVNGDGLPDIFGANWSGDWQPVELWINRTTRIPEK